MKTNTHYMKTNIHFRSYLAQFLQWKMSQTEDVEEIETHFMFNNFFPRKSYRLWDNVETSVEWGRPQMTIWRMRIACWIPKATNTHSEYVILIFALQQRLHERASWLIYTCISVLLNIIVHLTQLCVFVGLNYSNWIVMHGMKNVNYVPLCNAYRPFCT